MATLPIDDPLVTVEEYLHTSYRPDCDYVDGRIEERNVGEHDHGFLQILLGTLFTNHRQLWGVHTVTDVRIQVSAKRFRIPDISVMPAEAPRELILRNPPLIAIEILSPGGSAQPPPNESERLPCIWNRAYLGNRSSEPDRLYRRPLRIPADSGWRIDRARNADSRRSKRVVRGIGSVGSPS